MVAEAFVGAIEDDLGCEFDASGADAWSVRLDGSLTFINIDGGSGTMRVATPVEGASDGLPANDLLELLKFNFPNDTARSSWLAPGAAAGSIELVDVVPLGSLAPTEASRVVLDQIAASLVIAEQVAERRGKRLSRNGG